MKPLDTKAEFIRLRAEGKSYSKIAEELHISKGTCTAWQTELKEAIADLRKEKLEELYTMYGMTKEARIQQIGDTLANIDKALALADLSEVPPEKLLDYKLKYANALKEEYVADAQPYNFTDSADTAEITKALGDLLNRVRAGEVTTEQAGREGAIITSLLRAFEATDLQEKLDTIQAVLGARE